MNIYFNEINVDSIETNSGVFIGQNIASGFKSFQKSTSVFETVEGQNTIQNCISIIFDEDVKDMAIVNNDQFISEIVDKGQIVKRKNS